VCRVQWQQAHARFGLIDDDEGASVEVSLMLPQRGHEQLRQRTGQRVLCSNLHHARAIGLSCCEQRTKVEVVRDHDAAILACPRHDRTVCRATVSNC